MRNLKSFWKDNIYHAVILLGFLILIPVVSWAQEPASKTDVHMTFLSMDFFGYIDGAARGDSVTVTDPDGVVCGRFEINKAGQYGFLHVYGDDYATPEDEGARLGDILAFSLNGGLLEGHDVCWTGDSYRERVDFKRR